MRTLYTEGHTDHTEQNTSGVYVRLTKIIDLGVYVLEIQQFFMGKDMGRKLEAIDAWKHNDADMIREAIAKHDSWTVATCQPDLVVMPREIKDFPYDHPLA